MQIKTAYEITDADDQRGIRWTAKACSKLKQQIVLRKIQVLSGEATATDGRRLHRYYLEEVIPDGIYSPVIIGKRQVWLFREEKGPQFPHTENLFIDKPLLKKNVMEINSAVAELVRLTPEGIGINIGYLSDILSCHILFEVWQVPESPEYGACGMFQFMSKGYQAILMPMKL